MSKAEERANEAYPFKEGDIVYDEERVKETQGYYIEGYEQALKDIKEELDKRLESLWNKLPDGNDFLTGKETIEGASILGQYRALESFEDFIDTL